MTFRKIVGCLTAISTLLSMAGCGNGQGVYSLATMIDKAFDTAAGDFGVQEKLFDDAESGDPKAQEELGDYYFNGYSNKNALLNSSGHGYKNSYYLSKDLIEIPQDRTKAIEYYKKAALNSSGTAKAKLLFAYAIDILNQQSKDAINPFEAYVNAWEKLSEDLKSSINAGQYQKGISGIQELKSMQTSIQQREVMAEVCRTNIKAHEGSSIEKFCSFTRSFYSRMEKQMFLNSIKPYKFAQNELQAALWGMSGGSPEKNEIYSVEEGFVTVQQVIDGGVLVAIDLSIYGPSIAHYTLPKYMGFVKTNEAYVDGNNLKQGFYLCTGTMTYRTVIGANKTVYTFAPITWKSLNLSDEKFYFYKRPF